MKTLKTIIAALVLVLTTTALSAQSLHVVKQGGSIVVTDASSNKQLGTMPASPTATIPNMNFVKSFVVVDGTNLQTYSSNCKLIAKMSLPGNATVGNPTSPNGFFSVTAGGQTSNYDINCKPVN